MSLHWTLLIYQATSVRFCRYAPGHHQPPIWLGYGYDDDGATYDMLQPLKKIMFEWGQEVDNPLVSLVSAGSLFDDDNALCDIDDPSIKTLKYEIENLYENLFTVSQSFMEIAILFVGKWNDTTSQQDISYRLQSTNNISFQRSYCPTETKTIWDTIGRWNKIYKKNLVVKYECHEYAILPYPYLWLHWGV